MIDIGWLGFPNPNFYAMSAAMGHDYSIVHATAIGDEPLLKRNLRVDPCAIEVVLANLDEPDAVLNGKS